MFLVFNKEKIQTYIVSVLTVAVLITIANVRKVETVQTSSQEKELPIYNVQTDEKKVAFTMNCAWNADDIDKILETLQKNNVKITFFLVGEWVDKYPLFFAVLITISLYSPYGGLYNSTFLFVIFSILFTLNFISSKFFSDDNLFTCGCVLLCVPIS